MTNKKMNDEIVSQAKGYVPFFSQALLTAASEHDEKRLQELGVTAKRLYKDLSDYMDQCSATDLDSDILALTHYFRENAEEIEAALKHATEGDEWKQ